MDGEKIGDGVHAAELGYSTPRSRYVIDFSFSLAAPFVILSVIYNLTLGAINKAMPQLMVAFVGAPVITFGAIATLLVAAPFMLSVWLTAVEGFLVAPFAR